MQISKNEASITTWLLSQIELLEVTTGKKISTLALSYSKDTDGVDVALTYEEATPNA